MCCGYKHCCIQTFATCRVLATEGMVVAKAVRFLIDSWEEVWHTEWGRRQSVPWPNGKKIFFLSVWISIDKALVFAGFASISIPKGLAHTVSDKAGQNPFAHSFILPSANNFGTSGIAV